MLFAHVMKYPVKNPQSCPFIYRDSGTELSIKSRNREIEKKPKKDPDPGKSHPGKSRSVLGSIYFSVLQLFNYNFYNLN